MNERKSIFVYAYECYINTDRGFFFLIKNIIYLGWEYNEKKCVEIKHVQNSAKNLS